MSLSPKALANGRQVESGRIALKRLRVGAIAAAVLLAVTGLGTVTAANATNGGTVTGNLSDGCAVNWRASAVLDADLTNDDPEYPGLMVDLQGNPVHYTNGGYIEEVTSAFGDPGLFEMNHFYVGSGANLTQVWRVPVATDYTIKDAKISFKLPLELQGADVAVAFDPVSTNARIKDWGPTYAKYQWSQRAQAVDNGDGTWTVSLGDLPRSAGTVFQFNVAIGSTGLTPVDRFVASAELSGTYAPGTNGGNCGITDQPALPEPTPDLPPCTAEFMGQTLWTVYDRDITVRTKIQGDSQTDELGEVNSDGWGAGADAWGEGDTRTFRLYAATKIPLVDVTYVIDAVQGVTFDPASVTGSVSTPGGGQLQNNGYVEQVEGASVTANADGTQLTVHVDRMPAMSSLSFNATGLLDGTQATMALNHRLIGAIEGCEEKEPVVETSDWIETAKDCDTRTVTESRLVTTTKFEWDSASLTWVPQAPESVTETRQRDMTDSEAQECAQAVLPGDEDEEPVLTNPADQLPRTGGEVPLMGLAVATLLMLAAGTFLVAARRAG